MNYLDKTNTIKIDVRDHTKTITRLDIFNALLVKTNDTNLSDHINYISQYELSKFWFVTFEDTYNTKMLINEKLVINNEEYVIHDTKSPYINCTYKLSWLPHNTNVIHVLNFFKEISHSIEITDCTEEYCTEKQISKIKSGIFNVTGRILRENKDKVKLKSGVYDFSYGFNDHLMKLSCKIYLSVFLEKQKCFLCQSEDHIKSTCPTLNQNVPKMEKIDENFSNVRDWLKELSPVQESEYENVAEVKSPPPKNEISNLLAQSIYEKSSPYFTRKKSENKAHIYEERFKETVKTGRAGQSNLFLVDSQKVSSNARVKVKNFDPNEFWEQGFKNIASKRGGLSNVHQDESKIRIRLHFLSKKLDNI